MEKFGNCYNYGIFDSDTGVCSIDNYPDIQSLVRAAIKKHPVVSSTASKKWGTCPSNFVRV